MNPEAQTTPAETDKPAMLVPLILLLTSAAILQGGPNGFGSDAAFFTPLLFLASLTSAVSGLIGLFHSPKKLMSVYHVSNFAGMLAIMGMIFWPVLLILVGLK